MKYSSAVFTCWMAVFAASSSIAAAEPIKVLALGDEGHHQPRARLGYITPLLKARGVELTYTDSLADMNRENLAKYRGLLVYANIDAISPEAEKAVVEYVAEGGGFIPLHCATYCFRNSDAVVALMGGQFQKHGGEVFGVENAAPDHPIMKGFGGFESWDETYIHTKHNEQDRTVLEYRVKGGQATGRDKEPWTWTRTHGKGRVFYTAWGHDHRTWSNAGFQNLLERGIRWACNEDPSVVPAHVNVDSVVAPKMTQISKDAPKFTYVDVGAKIPNYTPSDKWGVQGDPLTLMQLPLPPEQSIPHYSVPEGFSLKLFVSEPELGGKPIAMTWDERGRLWVCETYDYPNELQPVGEGRDRIRICADTDGDGRADKFTVFAEKLSIPTAIAFHRGGAIVQHGSETLYLKDTNGDDVADERTVLFAGWGINDTHGQVSNFQYGLDNYVWAMQGYNNSEPTVKGVKQPGFRMGFFRFRGDGSEVEFLRSTNNNTWGFGMSEEGIIFGSTANRNPSVYMPIANRYYERVRGWGPEGLGTIADTYLFKAITPKVRQVDQHGGYTAGAGHALYTARNYPATYWNRTAFVCEPTGHLVGTFVLKRDGADFASTSPWNLAASDDEWASPIMAEVGPDGNVWMLDWYNFIIQHNPTPHGFKTGKGNAYESDLRDKKHGRVYRLVYSQDGAERKAESSPLSIDRPEELVRALTRDNLFWRRHAQRLLVERGRDDVVPALIRLLENRSSDSLGLNVGAIHALWTLEGLNVIDERHDEVLAAVEACVNHPAPGVRRNALQVLPKTSRTVDLLAKLDAAQTNDAQVRLASVLALSDGPATSSGSELAAKTLLDPVVLNDRWLADAAISAAAAQSPGALGKLAEGITGDPHPKQEQALRIVAEHMARSRPERAVATSLAQLLTTARPTVLPPILEGLNKGWPKDHRVEIDAAMETALFDRLSKLPPSLQGQLIRLAATWGSKGLAERLTTITTSLTKAMSDAGTSDADRVASALQFVQLQPEDAAAVDAVLGLIKPQTNPQTAVQFVEALSASRAATLGEQVVGRFGAMTTSLREAAIRMLLSRPQTTAAYLKAVEEGRATLSDLKLDQKQALSNHPDQKLRALARKLLQAGGGLPNPDRAKVVHDLLPVVDRKADAMAGKEIFKKQCAKCHMHSGEGQKIGPDLTGMAVHPKAELLVHILDPSRSVEGNFRVYTLVLGDGRVLNGMVASESRTALELIDTEAKRQSVAREDIEEIVASNKSIMPEGFEKQVTSDDLANLLEFLTLRGKYLPLPFAKAATIASSTGMFYDVENLGETMDFEDWSPKQFAGVPFILVDPQGGRAANVIMLKGPIGKIPPTMPSSAEVPCNAPVKQLHLLSGVSGWGAQSSPADSQVSMIVRFHYADGGTGDVELRNGEHFADYIRRIDVPGSQFAFPLKNGRQVRYLTVAPPKPGIVAKIEFVKGADRTAPVVMAATVETE